MVRTRGSLGWRDSELGQATAIVIAVVLVMVLMSFALYQLVSGQSSNATIGANSKQALQAAQAGLSEFQNLVKSNQAFGTSYCSEKETAKWTCGNNQTKPPTLYPAYVTKFTACKTSTSTSTHWAQISSRGPNSSGYQYVVNSSGASSGSGTIYVYVTGRAGQSKNYTCTSLAGSFKVQGAQAGASNSIAAAATGNATHTVIGSPTPGKPAGDRWADGADHPGRRDRRAGQRGVDRPGRHPGPR